MANNFLPFCETDTGTNLPTQGDYAVDPNRSIGNSPGVASSKLNNKPLRQATFVASQLAQYLSNKSGVDTLDNGVTAQFLAIINAALYPLPQNIVRYTSGSGTHNSTFYFFIAAGSATAGATYTNNAFTFTVVTTIAAGTLLRCTGNGAPTASGTLTKSGGTGDTTITFYAMRAPIQNYIKMIGGGGAGASTGTASTAAGGTGGTTTFGTSLLTAAGGAGGQIGGGSPTSFAGGTGGAVTVNSPALTVVALQGGSGSGANGVLATQISGGFGSSSPFGGAGGGAAGAGAGRDAIVNSGSGGGGSFSTSSYTGASGGGSGGYIEAIINNPSATYAYAVGAAGAAPVAGTGGAAGGAGGSGIIIVIESFQ